MNGKKFPMLNNTRGDTLNVLERNEDMMGCGLKSSGRGISRFSSFLLSNSAAVELKIDDNRQKTK